MVLLTTWYLINMTRINLTPQGSRHHLLSDASNSEAETLPLIPSPSGAPGVIFGQQKYQQSPSIDFSNLQLSDSISHSATGEETPPAPNSASPAPQLFQFNGADEPLPSIEPSNNLLSPSSSAPAISSPVSFSFEPTSRATHAKPHSSQPTFRLTSVEFGDRNTPVSPSGLSEKLGHVRLHSAEPGAGVPRYVSPQAQRPRSHSSLPTRRQASPLAPRHVVEDEQPPDADFYKPAFQQALQDAKALMSGLVKVLGSGEPHLEEGAAMQKFYQKAKELAGFQPRSRRIVAFVGDSGVGKSSVLNSLLDCDNFARSSDGGTACTCVATEYHYHNSNQLRLEAEIFNEQELQTRLEELVEAYQDYETLQADPGDEEDEEKANARERRRTAEQTFNAMFTGRFDSLDFILQDPKGTIVERMMTWASHSLQRLREIGIDQTFDTADECSERLTSFTSEQLGSEEDDFPLWPYIRKVCVYLKAHVLSQGLILVDLPGLRDLSATRRNATERCLLQCDDIMVVCHRDRATIDAGVESIFQLAKKAKLSSVGIICTKSDHNNAQEAERDWKGEKAHEIGNRITAVKNAKRVLETVKTRMAELHEVGDADLVEEERTELLRLVGESMFLSGSVARHKFELSRYISTIRNQEVISKLKETYKQHAPEGDIDVFCVSNNYYKQGRSARAPAQAAKVDALSWLNLSGILSLRKHCLGLIADSQYRLARRYMVNEIPQLASSLKLWVQAGSGTLDQEQKRAIHRIVDNIDQRLQTNDGYLSRIARELDDEFNLLPLRDGQRLQRWSKGAYFASQVWRTWHFQTYAAFCRNYGRHATKATGWVHLDWNEEAMSDMIKDLEEPWERFVDKIDGVCKIKYEEVQSGFEEALALLNELSGEKRELLSGSIEAIEDVLERCQDQLMVALGDLKLDFDKELGMLHTDALSSIGTSIFCKAMEETYHKAMRESGSGSDARRKSIVEGRLKDETIFRNLNTEFKSRFKQLTAKLQSDMRETFLIHVKEVKDRLNLVRDDNVDIESERDVEFREQVSRKLEDAAVEIRRIQGMV
ncbi:hypothetical protein QBC36DRAFT_341274 [Triangularia setosa]|uniref:Nuclear GTPase SLIP-GC n=1 Tax=Triangularia setosa TaxID=2587417 RepID=A0AAN7A0I0_9PEZI|nr:hypothetical protein QBC36DRAFT_341274 [Podospora setosa]